jgi:hypothetical protein
MLHIQVLILSKFSRYTALRFALQLKVPGLCRNIYMVLGNMRFLDFRNTYCFSKHHYIALIILYQHYFHIGKRIY